MSSILDRPFFTLIHLITVGANLASRPYYNTALHNWILHIGALYVWTCPTEVCMGSKIIGKDKGSSWAKCRNVDGINLSKKNKHRRNGEFLMVWITNQTWIIWKNINESVKVFARQRQNSSFGSGSPWWVQDHTASLYFFRDWLLWTLGFFKKKEKERERRKRKKGKGREAGSSSLIVTLLVNNVSFRCLFSDIHFQKHWRIQCYSTISWGFVLG